MGAPLSTTSPITFRSSQSLVSDHTSCELYLLSSGCELLPRQIHRRTSKGSENGASSSSLIQRETVNDPFNLLNFYNEWRWMTKCLWCCDRDKTLNQRVYRKTLRNPSNCVNNCLIFWFLYYSLFCCSLILLLFIFFHDTEPYKRFHCHNNFLSHILGCDWHSPQTQSCSQHL